VVAETTMMNDALQIGFTKPCVALVPMPLRPSSSFQPESEVHISQTGVQIGHGSQGCAAEESLPILLELILSLLQQLVQGVERLVPVLLKGLCWQAAQLPDLALQIGFLLLQACALGQKVLHLP